MQLILISELFLLKEKNEPFRLTNELKLTHLFYQENLPSERVKIYYIYIYFFIVLHLYIKILKTSRNLVI